MASSAAAGDSGWDRKGKAAGAASPEAENDDSGSSVVVVVEASEEREKADGCAGRIFGFSISGCRGESETAVVTHQFFPSEDVEGARAGGSSSAPSPRTHCAGVGLCNSSEKVVAETMGNVTKEEFVQVLRRQSSGYPRGSSKYRGVTLHKCGRWEARMDTCTWDSSKPKSKLRADPCENNLDLSLGRSGCKRSSTETFDDDGGSSNIVDQQLQMASESDWHSSMILKV
ncbi:hypothetical protein BHM03_00028005 [Ensete ventricosum]|nr:hypothetical protein BHM03_00028005 [Ensete ventricosum]